MRWMHAASWWLVEQTMIGKDGKVIMDFRELWANMKVWRAPPHYGVREYGVDAVLYLGRYLR
jgi:hypothetical protein